MNVRTLCLGVLSFGDATGYEIKKMAEDGLFSHFIEASFGSIYPVLTKMTEEGLLTCRAESQTGKPDRKVYSITPEGLSELRSSLTTFPRKDTFKSEFLMIMLLSGYLEEEHVRAVLHQRTGELAEELAMIEACSAAAQNPGTKFVNGYGQAVVGAALSYLRENADFVPGSPVPTQDDCGAPEWQGTPPSEAAE
ncbi:MAG: PadR family transcriptional regulator [Hyphomicrobiales bacterium]